MAFLVQEDFEGSGTPSGWFRGNSADFDYSGSPISGAQSLRLAAATGDYANVPDVSSVTEVWLKMRLRLESLPASAMNPVLFIETSGFSMIFSITIFADGSVTSDFSHYLAAGTVSAGVDYFVWVHYQQSSPAECRISTTDDRSNATALICASNSHALDRIQISGGDGTNIVTDDFQLADTDEFAGGGSPTVQKSLGSFMFPCIWVIAGWISFL